MLYNLTSNPEPGTDQINFCHRPNNLLEPSFDLDRNSYLVLCAKLGCTVYGCTVYAASWRHMNMSKLYFSKVICHLWSILSWRKNLILNFVIFKFSEKFGKKLNDSSSNFKMTFWIKIRNSASSYNRFVSSWKGMKSHFSHRHHLQALNATRIGQKFKNLIKILKNIHTLREMNLFWILAISSSVEG